MKIHTTYVSEVGESYAFDTAESCLLYENLYGLTEAIGAPLMQKPWGDPS